MEENILVNLAIVISAVATVAIAIFTWLNYQMYKKIEERNEEYKNQISDLYKAIVISNLLSGNSDLDMTYKKFNKEYTGKTKIFEK